MFFNKKKKLKEQENRLSAKANIPASGADKPVPRKGAIFLLGEEDNLENIMQAFFTAFGMEPSPGGNTLKLNNDDIFLDIVVVTQSMDDDAKAFVKEQSGKVLGHFYAVEAEKPDVKTNLIYQIDMTKSVIIINYSFDEGNEEYKLETIKAPLLGLLGQIGAVMLVMEEPDAIYYKDASGSTKLIMDDAGKCGVDVFLPYAKDAPDMQGAPEEALERRRISRKKLVDKGIFLINYYPLVETKKEASCRTPEEIAKRAVALLTVALYSEAMLGDHLSPKEAFKEYAEGIIQSFGAEEFFSPDEWEYLHNENSSEQDRVQYSWQYENLYVMEWALGLGKEEGPLDFPDHICDVPYTVRVLRDCRTIEDILKISKPKTEDELLDECDLIFCLDWACVDTRIKRLPAPAGMDGGVVMERHKSLNWLVGAYDRADWDNVSTDT